MCTVVFALDGMGGYWLAGNRDEAHWRTQADPPTVVTFDGVHAIRPTDPDGGGTWTAVNDAGVALSLLNLYQGQDGAQTGRLSRGILVSKLMRSTSLDAVARQLRAADMSCFAPFTLWCAGEDAAGAIRFFRWRWDGAAVSEGLRGQNLMFTSAAFDFPETQRWRETRWETSALRLTGSRRWPDVVETHLELDAFFSAHHPDDSSRSVCKHGAIASTVSHTRVHVTPSAVTMWYRPGNPCETERSGRKVVTLPRRGRQ